MIVSHILHVLTIYPNRPYEIAHTSTIGFEQLQYLQVSLMQGQILLQNLLVCSKSSGLLHFLAALFILQSNSKHQVRSSSVSLLQSLNIEVAKDHNYFQILSFIELITIIYLRRNINIILRPRFTLYNRLIILINNMDIRNYKELIYFINLDCYFLSC